MTAVQACDKRSSRMLTGYKVMSTIAESTGDSDHGPFCEDMTTHLGIIVHSVDLTGSVGVLLESPCGVTGPAHGPTCGVHGDGTLRMTQQHVMLTAR